MNVKALKNTRDAIAASHTYCQVQYMNECGTPACVAGHAVVANEHTLFFGINEDGKDEIHINGKDESVSAFAQDILGLTTDEAMHMFQGYPMQWASRESRMTLCDSKYMGATKEQAIAMLEYAMEHHKVLWT